jgi:creatinine amidohydrolase/Fe(II)-dependent formamide hydrolase-like protein
MAEADRFTFTYKEIAEALVKQQGIHEGLWGVYVEFGIGAANVGTMPESNDVVPAAIVPVQKIGLQRFPEANNLTVDATVVNPASDASAESATIK